MPLTAGVRLGAYEVVDLIGRGGMGEVYRAHDTRLHRDVALKTLPALFALDPDRLARFQREAQVLASLNHSNIAAIYGLEESDGVHALVLELVDGPTLADRIDRGPIPLDETLPIVNFAALSLVSLAGLGGYFALKPAPSREVTRFHVYPPPEYGSGLWAGTVWCEPGRQRDVSLPTAHD